ncbi:DUF192 domain-containing protein [Paraburkholderia domus]|uniref:DUF192 domain-containing protein n=1 Tax=Paraburkholderia domus TaxID=2793075 RepID=UPI001B19A145|nr:DUF192 domain-containing protein [Paraburkholderia domus]CAE6739145.1 hypothetical protein R75483_02581 [Paraburkholderia domus]
MRSACLITREHDIGIRVSITETAQERMQGLLGRDHLPNSEALLLRSCWAVHTFGMRFAIDILFLDRQQRVVAIHHDVPKRRMLVNLRAAQTLEMLGGTARQHELSVGDQLVFEATR